MVHYLFSRRAYACPEGTRGFGGVSCVKTYILKVAHPGIRRHIVPDRVAFIVEL